MADIDDSQSGTKALDPTPSGTQALKVSLGPAAYAPLIQAAAARHGVPPEVLAWVGHRESNFNPNAVGIPTSTGRAQGMYQFMQSTADELGIDPMKPAQAIDGAARYLRQLYNAHGDWEAAVKAYGTFSTGVGRDAQVQADFEKRFGNPKRDAGGFKGFQIPSSGATALLTTTDDAEEPPAPEPERKTDSPAPAVRVSTPAPAPATSAHGGVNPALAPVISALAGVNIELPPLVIDLTPQTLLAKLLNKEPRQQSAK